MFLERKGLRGRARALIPVDPKIYTHLPYVIELDDEVVRSIPPTISVNQGAVVMIRVDADLAFY